MKPIPNSKELSVTVHNWLTLTGNKVQLSFCKEEITTHEDYPAIIAVTDFLDLGSFNYRAVQADNSYIHEFNYPAIAHIKEVGNEYMHIIPSVKAWDEQNEITKYWSGIIIFPEKKARWNNVEEDAKAKEKRNQNIFFALWICIGITFFAITVYQHLSFSFNLFGFLSLPGIAVSIGAFSMQLGLQSSLVKQVCGALNKDGCVQVLKSKLGNGLLGITPADISLLYFTTQFIIYVVSSFYAPLFSVLSYLAIVGMGFAGISLYAQWVILKQWCALCIGIAGILLLQAGIAAFLIYDFSFTSLYLFAGIFLMLTLIFKSLKKIIKDNVAAAPKLAELKRWKSDVTLFMLKLQNEQAVDTSIWKNDLLIGSPLAPIMITVACNPFCGPCANTHKQLDQLLDRFPGKIKVQLRLLCNPENQKDIKTVAVKAILQQAGTIQNNNEMQQMLTDWFTIMNYQEWRKKWSKDSKFNVDEALNQHIEWIKGSNIRHTPTLFLNGRRLPGRYGLQDLEKIIPKLSEVIAGKDNSKN